MSVINLLYSALETGNWESVSEAYFILSGERITIPEAELDSATTMLKSMMDRLEKLEKQEPPKKNTKRGRPRKQAIQKVNDQVGENFNMKPNKPERTVKASKENKFDSMIDVIEEAKQEKGFDLIDDKISRQKSSREPYKKVNVHCIACQKEYDVNPLFARETYTCDKCLSRRK